MDDHQSEIIGEGVCDEEPIAGEVLKPNLRLRLRILASLHVDQREPASFAL